MTHSEQEEILRRALHEVADAIEPAADGLERIRERLSRPRPLLVAWLMACWTGLAQPLLLRIEPVLAAAAGRLSDRLADWLRLVIRSLRAAGERLRPAGQRLRLLVEKLRPAGELLVDAIRMLRPGSGMSRPRKLRAALAFGAAALIGVAGGFALSDGRAVVSAANSAISVFTSNPTHSSSPGGHGLGLNSPYPYFQASSSAPASVHKTASTPRPTCTPKPIPGSQPSSPPPSSTSPTTTPPSSTSPTTTPPSSTSPTTTPPSSTSPTPSPQGQQAAPGPGPSPAVNASASVGSHGTIPTVRQNPPGSVNRGSGQTRPGATTTPTTGVPAKPTPPPPTAGCTS
jgi:hypothetical protein